MGFDSLSLFDRNSLKKKKKKGEKLLFIQSNRRIKCNYNKDTLWRLRGRRTGIRVHFRSECRDFACIVRVCTRFQTERVRRHLSTRHLSYPVGRSCSMLTYWMVVFTCVDLYCVALDTGTNEKRMTFFHWKLGRTEKTRLLFLSLSLSLSWLLSLSIVRKTTTL